MSKIILVTGGARSGKSTFAESEIKKLDKKTAYIATAIAFDEGMRNRIEKHVAQRPSIWTTYEKPTQAHEVVETISKDHQVVLLDCITVLTTNTLFQNDVDWDTVDEATIDDIEAKIKADMIRLVEAFRKTALTVYLVTNEIGSGIVPENRLARLFRDIAGRINQYLGQEADEVFLVVSGIPVKIKG